MPALTLQALQTSGAVQHYLFPKGHYREGQGHIKFHFKNLTPPEQKNAILACINASSNAAFLIQGPAGSGKSFIAMEIIIFHAPLGRVLVTAPTNVAADELTMKLTKMAAEHLSDHNVKRLAPTTHISSICETSCFLDNSGQHRLPGPVEITEKTILVTTVATAGRLGFTKEGGIDFRLIVVDEAAFPLEYQLAGGILPLIGGCHPPRLVLLGDVHQICQRSPTQVASQWAANQSLFSRLLKSEAYQHERANKVILLNNHRNPKKIVDVMNKITSLKTS